VECVWWSVVGPPGFVGGCVGHFCVVVRESTCISLIFYFHEMVLLVFSFKYFSFECRSITVNGGVDVVGRKTSAKNNFLSSQKLVIPNSQQAFEGDEHHNRNKSAQFLLHTPTKTNLTSNNSIHADEFPEVLNLQ
jgi:hypothetical protein